MWPWSPLNLLSTPIFFKLEVWLRKKKQDKCIERGIIYVKKPILQCDHMIHPYLYLPLLSHWTLHPQTNHLMCVCIVWVQIWHLLHVCGINYTIEWKLFHIFVYELGELYSISVDCTMYILMLYHYTYIYLGKNSLRATTN